MRYKVTTPPAAVVTVADAKVHLRIESDDTFHDAWLTTTIAAATAWCENHARRAFGTQTLRSYCDDWPEDDVLHLPMPALQSVTSIKYFDTAGVEQTLDPSNYQVDNVSEPGRVAPAPGKSWPAVQSGRMNAITVEHICGWAVLDARAKEAIMFLVGHWFTNREAVVTGTISKEIEISLCTLLEQMWHGRLP